jgi:hypothetical protein
MRREYDYNLSKEENLAIEILEGARLNRYNTDNLRYEIDNSIGKKVFFTCVLSPKTNASLIEHYLNEFGIDVKFIDKSNPNNKRYLNVRID